MRRGDSSEVVRGRKANIISYSVLPIYQTQCFILIMSVCKCSNSEFVKEPNQGNCMDIYLHGYFDVARSVHRQELQVQPSAYCRICSGCNDRCNVCSL